MENINLIARHWHHLPIAEVVDLLESSREHGLDRLAVAHRLETFGPNAITAQKGQGPLIRFLLQFHQPLINILIASGLITAFLGEWVNSGVIFGVVLVNAFVGYIQEAKAVNALAALARTMTTEATVLRQGEKRRIQATELVPGDIVFLQSGDKVPADIRLYQVRDLQIAEASLTGESAPVAKDHQVHGHETALADRRNMAYASTLVTYGQGTGIITATGDETVVGRISQLISTAEALATPLTRKISAFSNVLLYVILALAGLTIVVGMLRGQSFLDMFMAAVAQAVGAIPEGLPAAVTITLAIGVSRMAKKRAIIRKLPVQILWINMTTAGFLGLALAFEPKEPGIMLRLPREPNAPTLTISMIFRITLVSSLMLVAAFRLFAWEQKSGATLAEARTAAVNVFVMIELFYLFNCRSLEKNVFQLGFFSNPWVLGGTVAMFLLQVAYTYLPVMNRLFQSAPVDSAVWGRTAAAGVVVFVLVEIEKWLWQKNREGVIG